MSAIADWVQRAGELISRPKNCGDRHFEDDGLTAGDDRAGYLPTPEEIRAACREIQSEWTPEEEQSRRAKRVPWAVPQCRRMTTKINLED